MKSVTNRFAAFLTALLAAAAPLVSPGAPASPDYDRYASLLEAFVSEDGVRYAAWRSDTASTEALDRFLEEAAGVDVGALGPDARKAFYLNLYNAAMLQAVLDRYPLDSVKQIGPEPFWIFGHPFIEQGGRTLSLDDVEKGILLEEFADPRIHFAVNCASESCPALRSEPYRAEELDAQLDAQARQFARSSHAAIISEAEEAVAFSKLFDWYADDFGVEHPARYLNRFRESPLPVDYAVRWQEYDWSLNEAP